VDSNRQLYDSMLQRVKESGIDAALKASNVRVVDPAIVPKRPYSPSTRTNAALGMLLGLFFGAGLVIMRERADRSIKTPGETPAWLSVPELGVIPTGVARSRNSPVVFAGDAPRIAESFRVVMTSILISGQNGSPWQTLVCTSSKPGEGKTTVAAHLAVALARIGRRVLLIDADLSRPSLHRVFGVSNEAGLTTLLQSPSITEEALETTIQRASDGVSLLPAGPQMSGAADLLFANDMPDLLAVLKDQFDIVLIDAPPTPQMSHARLFGKMADGVILVVRAGKTTREAVMATLQQFAVDRIPVIGTVLNDWNPKRSPSEYYSAVYNGRRNGRAAASGIQTQAGDDRG
jgi:capsular exopolysaccharide synthesis family protein